MAGSLDTTPTQDSKLGISSNALSSLYSTKEGHGSTDLLCLFTKMQQALCLHDCR